MSFEKKRDSIFEIKINEQRIASTFKAIEDKLANLEERSSQCQRERDQKGIFNCSQDKLKIIINQIVYNAIRPLQQSSLEHDRALSNIQYNHQNLCCNIGQELKALQSQFQNCQQELSRKLAEDEVKTKTQLETNRMAIKEEQSLLKRFMEEQEEKDSDYQEQISKVWEALKKGRKDVEPVQNHQRSINKSSNIRRSQMKQPFSIFNDSSNMKRSSTIKKSFNKEDSSSIQIVQCKQKTVQFASLLAKIESLQRKFNEFAFPPVEEKTLTSKYRIEAEGSVQNLPQNEALNLKISQAKKKFKGPKLSRFRNSINLQDQSQHSIVEIKQEKDASALNQEVCKINARLNDFKYKYTLLQENHQIVLNKIAKLAQMQSSIQLKMDEAERLRVDLATINEINMRFRRIQSSFEQQQSKYVLKEQYTKEVSKIKQTLKQIQSIGSLYARHDEIKSAFEFIETKIKEIVIVLTDKFQKDKEGAINKIQQIRCLTCDKQFQRNSLYNRGNCSAAFSRNSKLRNQRSTCKRIKTEDC